MKHDRINPKDFLVYPGEKVKLRKRPTTVKFIYKSKKDYKKILAQHIKELSSLQNLLYASNRYSVLLIFQAMDAAGKDSAIKHVMSLNTPSYRPS
jgi:polyphosphate kinase 2 (PPK2 family)